MLGAQGLYRPAVRQVLIMSCRQHVGETGDSGRMTAGAISEHRLNVGLVEHRPVLDAVAQAPGRDLRIVGELFSDVAVGPAALLLQRLRQVPMIEAKPRRNAARNEPIDQAIVKIKAARFDGAGARRQNSRPRRREAISLETAAGE